MNYNLINLLYCFILINVAYYINHLSNEEYTCDCNKLTDIEVFNNINFELISDNLKLKKELEIVLDHLNTNVGNVSYTYFENINDVTYFDYDNFITEFYDFKKNTIVNLQNVILSKKQLYYNYLMYKNAFDRSNQK
jgi:hypothetical protein